VRVLLRNLALVGVVLLAIGAGPHSCFFPDLDAYQGWTGMQLTATGRFRVEQVDGVWWIVTPDGHPFFSAGVNNVDYCTDQAPALGTCPYQDAVEAKYGGVAAWSDAVLARMTSAGLNTIGAWSDLAVFRGRFPYTEILGFASGAPKIPGTASPYGPELRDYFAQAFADHAASEAEAARDCADDAYCIGVYTDNELPWGPSLTQTLPFVDAYMKLPAGAPGKLELQAFLESRWAGDLAAFNAAWQTALGSWDDIQSLDKLTADYHKDPPAARADRIAFRAHVADRYFRVAHDALRAVAGDVLILGARFIAHGTGADTAQAAGPWVDVLSANAYEWSPAWRQIAANGAIQWDLIPPGDEVLDDLDVMYAAAGKPILITEFSYRAADAGLPNSYPPVYPVLPDQTARADAYEAYLRRALARPWIVGAHWFEWADEPATGRSDGEDDNWGFVTIDDEVYPELFLRMWSVHQTMYETRAALAQP
jgi:agarase